MSKILKNQLVEFKKWLLSEGATWINIKHLGEGRDVLVYDNPDSRKLRGLINQSEYKQFRGNYSEENDLFVWDASGGAQHKEIARSLGLRNYMGLIIYGAVNEVDYYPYKKSVRLHADAQTADPRKMLTSLMKHSSLLGYKFKEKK